MNIPFFTSALVATMLIDACRRNGFWSLTALYLAYVLFCLVVLQIFMLPFVQGSRLIYFPKEIILYGSSKAAMLYTFVGSLGWIAIRIAGVPATSRPSRMLAAQLGKLSLGGVTAISAALCVGMIIHATELDWSAAMHSNTYLVLNDAHAMGEHTAVGVGYHYLMPLTLLFSGPVLLVSLIRRAWLPTVFSGLNFVYCFAYESGTHSRWAGVSLILTGFVAMMLLSKARAAFVATLMLLVGAASYLAAIAGRNSGEHGLSTIISTFRDIQPALIGDYLFTTVYTLAEGIFVTAQAFSISGEHSTIYKLLSFSPLPSQIDHFDAIRMASQIRISWVVPIGSWSEAIMFGPLYFFVLSCTVFVLFIVNARVSLKSSGLAVSILTVSSAAILIFANAYPIRNDYRFLLALIIVHVAALLRIRRSKELATKEPVHLRPGTFRPGRH